SRPCFRCEPLHNPQSPAEFGQHRPDHAADGALLAPHLYPVGLRLPKIPTVKEPVCKLVAIFPGWDAFWLAGLIDDPAPRDIATLSRDLKPAVNAIHLVHAV